MSRRILNFDGRPNLYAYIVSLPVGTVICARYKSYRFGFFDDELYEVGVRQDGKRVLTRMETHQSRVLKMSQAIKKLLRYPECLFIYSDFQGRLLCVEEVECV